LEDLGVSIVESSGLLCLLHVLEVGSCFEELSGGLSV
jgi:hypothetical protein